MRTESLQEIIRNCKQTIDVIQFGADPTGETDSTKAIWLAFESAKDIEGQVVIEFPQGIYQLQKGTAQQRAFHTSNTDSMRFPLKHIALLLEDQEQVILNGNGSMFMIHGDCMAIAIIRSKEVYLHNFAWDYAVPTTAEMTVIGIGEQQGQQYTDFSIPACFPFTIDDKGENLTWYSEHNPVNGDYYWVNQNDKETEVLVCYHPAQHIAKRYAPNLGPLSARRQKISRLNKSEIRVLYGQNRPELHQKDVVFEIRPSAKRDTAGAFIWESSDTIIEKVAVHYMHGFGWLTQMSHNVTFIDCMFTNREGSGKYTSSFADSLHVSGASGHIHIEGCTFSHPHDDAINIHGTFTRVEEKIDRHTLRLRYVHRQTGGFPQYYVGNEVLFYRRDTLTPVLQHEQPFIVTETIHPGEDGNDLVSMIVTFDQPIPEELLQVDEAGESLIVAENSTYMPSVHIKNNVMEAIPTRGILCTTRKEVRIEENTFKNLALDAIYISNDAQDWYEAGPVREMTIRANTFYIPKVGQGETRNAAIRIHPITKVHASAISNETIHKNIRIEDNQFYMAHESVLVADRVQNLQFMKNKIGTYPLDKMGEFAEMIVGDQSSKELAHKTFELTACEQVIIEQNICEEEVQLSLSYEKMPAEHIKIDHMLKKFV